MPMEKGIFLISFCCCALKSVLVKIKHYKSTKQNRSFANKVFLLMFIFTYFVSVISLHKSITFTLSVLKDY